MGLIYHSKLEIDCVSTQLSVIFSRQESQQFLERKCQHIAEESNTGSMEGRRLGGKGHYRIRSDSEHTSQEKFSGKKRG